jgi:hypothetical protein
VPPIRNQAAMVDLPAPLCPMRRPPAADIDGIGVERQEAALMHDRAERGASRKSRILRSEAPWPGRC